MTDLDSPKKNNDCYFYYYSTCAKGDNCTFRHEPSALGCETMCSFWKEGKCLNVRCNFRHMELRKNRKAIPCYWETQPGGCLKPHCPFMHQNPKPNEVSVKSDKAENRLNETYNQSSDTYKNVSAVDSLVVNFEEESDNESAPTTSPVKPGASSNSNTRVVKVKTLEEIKLEKIQAASAAYYSYSTDEDLPLSQTSSTDSDDLRQRIINRIKTKQSKDTSTTSYQTVLNDIETKVGPKRKLSNDEIADILGDDSLRQYKLSEKDMYTILNDESTNSDKYKKQKLETSMAEDMVSTDFKIKTLQEIRQERSKNKQKPTEESLKVGEKRRLIQSKSLRLTRPNIARINKKRKNDDEAEVSSTSTDEHILPESIITYSEIPAKSNPSEIIVTCKNECSDTNLKPVPLRMLNLNKRLKTTQIFTEENTINSSNLEENVNNTDDRSDKIPKTNVLHTQRTTGTECSSKEIINIDDKVSEQIEEQVPCEEVLTTEKNTNKNKGETNSEDNKPLEQNRKIEECSNNESLNLAGSKECDALELSVCDSDNKDVMVDESVLLLDDDDEHLENNVTLKAEEDLLNEIDDFLDD